MFRIANRPDGPRRRSRLRLLAVVAAMLAVATACGAERTETAADGGTGNVLDPSVLTGEATTIAGDTVDLAAFADQDLVVWFWAPW